MNVPLSEQVARVERKLEVRRARTRRHWQEVQSDVHRIAERSARWTPLVGVAAVALLGFTLARQGSGSSALVVRRAGAASVWASVVALATTALRIALSPQGRQVWNAWRRARAGPP
jgi:hypothetical protein